MYVNPDDGIQKKNCWNYYPQRYLYNMCYNIIYNITDDLGIFSDDSDKKSSDKED